METVEDIDHFNFKEIKSKLELRFEEGQNYYTQFANRKQKFGEDLASFGADIEKLARLSGMYSYNTK